MLPSGSVPLPVREIVFTGRVIALSAPAFAVANVQKVVVDEGSITGDTKPILIYADQPKVAGGQS